MRRTELQLNEQCDERGLLEHSKVVDAFFFFFCRRRSVVIVGVGVGVAEQKIFLLLSSLSHAAYRGAADVRRRKIAISTCK